MDAQTAQWPLMRMFDHDSPVTAATKRYTPEGRDVFSVSRPSSRVQVYLSRSSDPYLNLSIEHFLLQKSHPDSVVLLLYTNSPCVVIGRNQNPWVEHEDVQLVRRRSGGGTVFHDAGNVNWSIICPPAIFDRDKHAEMVVRALRGLSPGTDAHKRAKLDVRVNERHDIVMDVPASDSPAATTSAPKTETFKISGSAYKLTRLRSLHHGTLLLSSPNLPVIGQFLRSPAEPYIKARGVESVRSPIRNVGLSNDPGSAFERAVIAEFGRMYSNDEFLATKAGETAVSLDPETISPETAESLLTAIPAIGKGYDELRSRDWIFAQTPQFTFSTHPTEEDPRPRPPLDTALRRQQQPGTEASDAPFRAHLTVRHGQVAEAEISSGSGSSEASVSSLMGATLHEIQDWTTLLGQKGFGAWFNSLFGVRPPP
ncbi:hypothetical protein Micbo1qcDRAFT_190457 [Microdochium bolleyi]|uniref:Putative lipoate-protein ligase A n=1 Tax=Microdochium bolleyi TaxID=196109 RepID=A0A136INZ7_9PEZI|nr:hypothetical protein Micbo1qcDRAFT_190457 [Microdochium bolleyi]